MPVPLQRLVSPPKHAEGYCAATRGEKGRGWLMRWLPSLAHDNGMIRDPPCGASPGTPRCPADCSSAAPNPGCRAREAGGGLGMFELSGACGPSVARQFSNPGTDRPALEPELDQRDPGTRPRRRRRIRATAFGCPSPALTKLPTRLRCWAPPRQRRHQCTQHHLVIVAADTADPTSVWPIRTFSCSMTGSSHRPSVSQSDARE